MRIDSSGKPMMSDREIEYIEAAFEQVQFKYCLEWGSGNSTVYFPEKFKCIQKWVSIEHNGHYVDYLADKISNNVINIWADGDWYVDCVKLQKQKYDFILIDGQQRGKCLDVAFQLLNKHGIILLHDSGRQEYQEFIKKYNNRSVLFEGELPLPTGYFAHRGLTLFWNNE